MRMYAKIKEPYKCNKYDFVYQVMLHQINDIGTYAYIYTEENAIFSKFDCFYETIEDALEEWQSEIDENGWTEIEDPMKGCQSDCILPIRMKGRNEGNPQWGEYEIFENGAWVEFVV